VTQDWSNDAVKRNKLHFNVYLHRNQLIFHNIAIAKQINATMVREKKSSF